MVNGTGLSRCRWLPCRFAWVLAAGCGGVDAKAECGDDRVQGDELCDGTDLAENDCTTIGEDFGGGTLACNETCDGWDTTECAPPPGSLAGTVEVGFGIFCDDAPLDCVGTVFVFVVEENPAADPRQIPLASTFVPDADLSNSGYVSYSLPEVPAGTWFIGAFQDDDGNVLMELPAPGIDDPVPFPFPEVTIVSEEPTTRDIVLTRRL